MAHRKASGCPAGVDMRTQLLSDSRRRSVPFPSPLEPRRGLEQTARQTAELFGVRWGGLYGNYAFTAVWALDVIAAVIHCFIAFLFFNAAVVFVSGWVRWLGLTVAIALGILWLRRRRTRPGES